MNSNFDKDIDTLRNQIAELNKQISNESNINNVDELPKQKVIKGNAYALSQFQYRVSSLNYRRTMKNNVDKKEENINSLDSMKELNSFISENDYKKKWNKLDNYQKKKKLVQYINQLIQQNIITSEEKKNITANLMDLLKKGKLKSNNVVNYNLDNKMIESISILDLKQ